MGGGHERPALVYYLPRSVIYLATCATVVVVALTVAVIWLAIALDSTDLQGQVRHQVMCTYLLQENTVASVAAYDGFGCPSLARPSAR